MCKPARLNTGARQRHATRGKLLLSAELDGNIWSRAHVGEREQDFTGIWGFGFCRFMNLGLVRHKQRFYVKLWRFLETFAALSEKYINKNARTQ